MRAFFVAVCLALSVPAAVSLAAGPGKPESPAKAESAAKAKSSAKGPRGPRGKTGARGYTGYAGAAGAAGATGATGAPGISAIRRVTGASLTLLSGQYGGAPNATCPAGYTSIGTGFSAGGVGIVGHVINYTYFVGGFFDNPSSITIQVYVQATCAALPAGASISSKTRSSEVATYLADVAAATKNAEAAGLKPAR